MKRLVFLFFVLGHCGRKVSGILLSHPINDSIACTKVGEIIVSKGYPLEEHTVQTADGYLLSLQRIPRGRSQNRKEDKKKVVLLIHGEATDASTWLVNYYGRNLGFILPDEGYDVWLLNHRGSKYSKKHVKYKTNDYKFWNYSFQELAQYDVPDTVDYILKITGVEALYIIGHSRGTTSTFAMLSEKPEYNDKVNLFIAFAPAVFVGHTIQAIRFLAPFALAIAMGINLVTSGEFDADNKIAKNFMAKFCGGRELCQNIFFPPSSENSTKLNESTLNFDTVGFFSSTSTKSLQHFAQLIKSEKFRKFDYGPRRNLKYYQQENPPNYDLSRISAPVALFWSANDVIVNPIDVDILRGKLKSVVFDYCVPYPYTHIDFLFAENALELIYGPVLELLAEY